MGIHGELDEVLLRSSGVETGVGVRGVRGTLLNETSVSGRIAIRLEHDHVFPADERTPERRNDREDDYAQKSDDKLF